MNKNKIITLLGLFAMSMMVMAQGSEKLVSNQILNQKVVDEGGSGMFNAVALEEKDDKGRDEKANNFKTLWINNGDRNIFGIIGKPHYTGKKQPIAIIAHGFNGTHAYSLAYFNELNKMGYQCYAFDFPCGSLNSRSDNNTHNMSILDEQSDLEAIVKYFKSQPDIDADNIVLIGESQGGLVSALTAASLPKDVTKLVLVFPALCIPDNWNQRYPKVSDIPDTTTLWDVPIGRRFFLEIRDMDVFKTIKRFKKPVLIVQGDADAVVSMDDSRRAVKNYKTASLHVIPSAGHGFKPQEFEESMGVIKEFLSEE